MIKAVWLTELNFGGSGVGGVNAVGFGCRNTQFAILKVSVVGRFLPIKDLSCPFSSNGLFLLENQMANTAKEFNFTQFAFAVGANDRLTQDASLPFHEEYVANEDKAFRVQMRKDWVVSYIAGNLGISQAKAIKIAELTRVARNELNPKLEEAVNRASKQFTYHIVRPDATTSKQADLVKQALALYAKMSGAQKRSFKAQL